MFTEKYYNDPTDDVTELIPQGKVIGFVKTVYCLEWIYDISYGDVLNKNEVRALGFNVGTIKINGIHHLLISLDCKVK